MKNKIIYVFSLFLIVIGAYASEILSNYKDIYGTLSIFIAFLTSFFIFSFSDKGKSFINFLKKSQNELKYIEWVKKEELNKMTLISFFIIFITTILVLFFDTVIFKVISLFLY